MPVLNYTRKQVSDVTAIQWTGDNLTDVVAYIAPSDSNTSNVVEIRAQWTTCSMQLKIGESREVTNFKEVELDDYIEKDSEGFIYIHTAVVWEAQWVEAMTPLSIHNHTPF